MSITKNCGCKPEVPCGCGDNVYTTNTTCNSPECLTPEKCSETYSSECVLYMGDTIGNLDIKKGDKLTEVIQRLVMAIVNPTCSYPTSSCNGAVAFGSVSISASTIKLEWEAVEGATSYEVEYRPISSGTWILNGSVTATKDTLAGLAANTEYAVRVKTLCGANPCYSLTLLITTKP